MRLPADLFLALRYLRPKRTFVSAITLLSILGPVLGVAVLIIVSSVMAGFDKDIRHGIMDMDAHMQIFPIFTTTFENPDDIIEKIKPSGIAASPIIEGSALIQIRKEISPKLIRGIVPSLEARVSKVHSSILQGRYELKEGEALVGDSLAAQLGMGLGDSFLIHSPARLTQNVKWKDDGTVDVSTPDEVYLPEQVRIVGIYSLGISDFDSNIIFLHLDQAASLYGYEWDSATCVHCKVPDPLNMNSLTDQVEDALTNVQVVTWQERNQLLFSTLRVEKNLMTFLMAFIVLVASFSIAATLITVVVQKTREIGVMKAVGMSRAMIARVFLLQGTIIGVIGTAFGTMLGLLVIFFRDKIADIISFVMGHDVFPAELYHLRQIPALTTWQDLTFTICLSVIICILSAIVPALFASNIAPAKALQEEN